MPKRYRLVYIIRHDPGYLRHDQVQRCHTKTKAQRELVKLAREMAPGDAAAAAWAAELVIRAPKPGFEWFAAYGIKCDKDPTGYRSILRITVRREWI